MKIKEAIKYLEGEIKAGHTDIIIAWWTKDMAPIDAEEVDWEDQCTIIDHKMSWSTAHEDMATVVDMYIDDYFEDRDIEQQREIDDEEKDETLLINILAKDNNEERK